MVEGVVVLGVVVAVGVVDVVVGSGWAVQVKVVPPVAVAADCEHKTTWFLATSTNHAVLVDVPPVPVLVLPINGMKGIELLVVVPVVPGVVVV